MTPPYVALVLKIIAIVLLLMAAFGRPLAGASVPLALALWCASTL